MIDPTAEARRLSEKARQIAEEHARMEAFRQYAQDQIAALREIAEASKQATENAEKAAKEAGKTAKRALVAAWVSGVASSISAIASIVAIFL